MYTYPTLKNTKYISNIDITEDQINSNTVIEGEFSIPLSIMTGATRQEVNKETRDLNIILGEWDLIDLHRTSTQQQHNTQFSQVHTKYSQRWTIC